MRVVAELQLCPYCAVAAENGDIAEPLMHVTDDHEFGRITCDHCGTYWLGEYFDAVQLGH